MNRPGFLLVIEGIDGAGKSTVIRRFVEWCGERGWPCIRSKEPTDGVHGSELRRSAVTGRLPLEREIELFLLDRTEHVETLIRPALAEGKIVILDRYYLSTAAYQGARGADPAEILRKNEVFAPAPDLALILDLDPDAGLTRVGARGDRPDAFEAAQALRDARRIFLGIERPFIRVIDASRSADAVFADCLREFEARYARE